MVNVNIVIMVSIATRSKPRIQTIHLAPSESVDSNVPYNKTLDREAPRSPGKKNEYLKVCVAGDWLQKEDVKKHPQKTSLNTSMVTDHRSH